MTIFPPESHHTKEDKVTSVETIPVTELCYVSTTLPADPPDNKEGKIASDEPLSVTVPFTQVKVAAVEPVSIAEVSSVSTTLPTESQHKKHKVSAIKPMALAQTSES